MVAPSLELRYATYCSYLVYLPWRRSISISMYQVPNAVHLLDFSHDVFKVERSLAAWRDSMTLRDICG